MGLGPWGKDYRMGEAGNRHSLPAARRTAAMLRELLLVSAGGDWEGGEIRDYY